MQAYNQTAIFNFSSSWRDISTFTRQIIIKKKKKKDIQFPAF